LIGPSNTKTFTYCTIVKAVIFDNGLVVRPPKSLAQFTVHKNCQCNWEKFVPIRFPVLAFVFENRIKPDWFFRIGIDRPMFDRENRSTWSSICI